MKEAQAIQGKAPYDEYLTNEMFGFIYTAQKQYGEAVKPLDSVLSFDPPVGDGPDGDSVAAAG